MSEIITLGGKLFGLKYLVGELGTTERLRARLFTNDITPTENSLTGDFSEANFLGYAGVLLTSWSFTEASIAIATSAEAEFLVSTTGAAQLVYGVYITREVGTELVAAKRFTNGPYSMEFYGDGIKVQPILRLSDG